MPVSYERRARSARSGATARGGLADASATILAREMGGCADVGGEGTSDLDHEKPESQDFGQDLGQ